VIVAEFVFALATALIVVIGARELIRLEMERAVVEERARLRREVEEVERRRPAEEDPPWGAPDRP
jgi:hypothetical protein